METFHGTLDFNTVEKTLNWPRRPFVSLPATVFVFGNLPFTAVFLKP